MSKNFLGIILILAALGMTFVWTRSLWEESKVLIAKKQELSGTLERFQELRRVRDDLLAKYNSIPSEDLDKLKELLPRESGEEDLLVNLESLSGANGIRLKSVNIQKAESARPTNFGEVAPSSRFGTLSVDFSMAASYESFRSFLENLEKNRRLIDVENITFASGRVNSYEFNVQAKTYWQTQ